MTRRAFPGDFSSLINEEEKAVLQGLLQQLKREKEVKEIRVDMQLAQDKEMDREKERGEQVEDAIGVLVKTAKKSENDSILHILGELREGFAALQSYQKSNPVHGNDIEGLEREVSEWKRILDSIT